MEIKASQSYVRGGQQKMTDVTRVIKKLSIPAMRRQLTLMNKDAARRILETLDQAIANAQHNFGISLDNLELKELLILRGPHYKRFRAVSRGTGHAILKRTSHIVVTLKTKEEVAVTKSASDEKAGEIPTEAKKTETKPAKKTSRRTTSKKEAKK